MDFSFLYPVRRPGRRRRVLLVALAAAAPVLTTMAILPPGAQAAFSARGPIDPGTGFPGHYTDSTGLSLQLCLDGPPLCLGNAADLLDNGADGEGFYSSVTATAGGLDMGLDLEAAYFDAGADQEIVFARSQYAGRQLVPNGTYTVTDPYGTTVCTANGAGAIPNNACRDDHGGNGPLDFDTALSGRLGPFLTWDTFGSTTNAPPAGYIGDGATEHRIIGSPTGFNKFRVQGPGIASTCVDGATVIPGCEETDLFVVSGKIAPGPAGRLDRSADNFGNVPDARSATLTYSSFGTQNAVVTGVSTTGAAFSSATTCGTVVPGDTCTVTVTYAPTAGEAATGTLTVTDNTSGSPRTVSLSGRSVPVSSVDRAAVDHGSQGVVAGATPPVDVVVTNTGAAPLHVSSVVSDDAEEFPVTNGCTAPVAPLGSCTVGVAFDPAIAGVRTAAVRVESDGGNHTVAMTGRGTQAAIGTPAGLSFGDTAVGRTARRTLTVTNNGSAALTLSSIRLTGPDAARFSLRGASTNLCVVGAPIAVNAQCEVPVSFSPSAAGPVSGALELTGADAARTVVLTGHGVDTTAPRALRRNPAPGAVRVKRNKNVVVTFTEPVRGVKAATFTLTDRGSGKVRARISHTGNRWVLNPTARLRAKSQYRVRLVGGARAIRDMSGNPLKGTTWTFRTR